MSDWRLPRMTRRRFLGLAGGAISSGVGAYGYARWVEPHWLDVVRRDLPVVGLPDSLVGRTLAHVSDLHVGSTDPDHLAASLRLVSALGPDLVVITGDFMTCDWFEQVDAVPRVLSQLRLPPLGCFAVLGNHDYGAGWSRPEVADRLAARLAGSGVQLLRNESRTVPGLTLVGVDDLWAGRCRPADALGGLDPKRPTLALCHNPDSVDGPGWGGFQGWVLAGHTHGGQSSFFDDPSRFPPGSVAFDCALLMRVIEHEWHGLPDLCCGAGRDARVTTPATG